MDVQLNNLMERELQNLFTSAVKSGIKKRGIKDECGIRNSKDRKKIMKHIVIASFLGVIFYVVLCPTGIAPFDQMKENVFKEYKKEKCLMETNGPFLTITRPIVDCKICRGIKQVPVSSNMTRDKFMKTHAYTGLPVLVKGGASHWKAVQLFQFEFLKNLYTNETIMGSFDKVECDFFEFKTNFTSLKEVFAMDKERASMKQDQWYIGWCNCVEQFQHELRKYYERPNFLPRDSESSNLDWLFMGGSGKGTMMHIDNVYRPSWQAMIRGKKTWYIEPPPECESECPKNLSATMEPGDILVVDTNRWFHSTYIHPGEMSITIGSEYD